MPMAKKTLSTRRQWGWEYVSEHTCRHVHSTNLLHGQMNTTNSKNKCNTLSATCLVTYDETSSNLWYERLQRKTYYLPTTSNNLFIYKTYLELDTSQQTVQEVLDLGSSFLLPTIYPPPQLFRVFLSPPPPFSSLCITSILFDSMSCTYVKVKNHTAWGTSQCNDKKPRRPSQHWNFLYEWRNNILPRSPEWHLAFRTDASGFRNALSRRPFGGQRCV